MGESDTFSAILASLWLQPGFGLLSPHGRYPEIQEWQEPQMSGAYCIFAQRRQLLRATVWRPLYQSTKAVYLHMAERWASHQHLLPATLDPKSKRKAEVRGVSMKTASIMDIYNGRV